MEKEKCGDSHAFRQKIFINVQFTMSNEWKYKKIQSRKDYKQIVILSPDLIGTFGMTKQSLRFSGV